MTRNMFDLTPLFNPSALPFSYSTPEAPPSPDMASSFDRNSSSNSAIVFFFVFVMPESFASLCDGWAELGVLSLFDGDDLVENWAEASATAGVCDATRKRCAASA
ncbi:hypothetical protein C8035_v006973 [Colletotrichum spinosum]|uniref:Uncharacterized protein n=1 Tax=Colletotrichum spinosum TaxID=1347390 RepID=A0A4R8QEW3_9PEZI|nr:hypothetical protein C8035_v006973 [Colletotrichum spinosum]